MTDIPQYPALKKPELSTVERSVSREGAFSKPGSTKSASKGWKPAHGTRFRPTNEKAQGRPRIRKRDPRNVKFY